MIKRMLLLLAVMIVAVGAKASSVNAPLLKDASGIRNSELAQSLEMVGASACRVEASTGAFVAVLCASGSGLLLGVDMSSGSAGNYALGLDSASTSGVTVASQGKALSPQVVSPGDSSATGCSTGSVCGSFNPARPRRFSNGLVAIKSAAGANAILWYRLDSAN